MTGHLRMLEAAAAFILSAYDDKGLRKIYAEVPDFVWARFKAGEDRYFHREGRLIDYLATPTGFADLHIIAFDRMRWADLAPDLRLRIGLR